MKMSLVVDGLRSDVVAVGELGDDAVAEAAERIAAVLARSAPARILDLLSDAAAELSADAARGAGRDPGRRRRRGPGLRRGRARPRRRWRRRPVGPHHPPPRREPEGPGGGRRIERGRLGEHVHRAHARARDIGTDGAVLGEVGTACAGTARPEGTDGDGEDIRDAGGRAALRGERGRPGRDHRARDGHHGGLARARPRPERRSSSSVPPSSAGPRGAATSWP